MALALSGSAVTRALLAAKVAAAPARSYAAAAAAGPMRRAVAGTDGKGSGQGKEGSAAVSAAREVSWVPDPVTGHYRPSNWAGDAVFDAADLRAAHLARS
ncbi:hypothetical protein ABZP36_027709 [Zizania latifolia]